MSNNSFTTIIFNFLKKQCLLSFLSVFILVLGSLIVFDSKISPISLSIPEPPELIGPLALNYKLRAAQILHFRRIKGCESLVNVDGYIYSTTQDGNIVKFNDSYLEIFTKLHSEFCRNIQECGRPLGIRYDSTNKQLLVVDSYHGLFKIDIDTRISKRIFPKSNDSFQVTFFNDFDLLPNGDVIISESSTKYQLHNMISLIFEGRPNGRILQVNPTTGEYRIIIDNIYFPNGVQMHKKDPNIVLVVETLKLRVLAINIDENCPISQRSKVFVDFLPGFPDNIRPAYNKGGYWISFATIRHSANSFMVDTLFAFPFLKNSIKKLISDSIIHMIMRTNHGIIIRVDEFGNVVESLQDPEGLNVTTSSETLEIGNSLYLGNYYLPFIVKINL